MISCGPLPHAASDPTSPTTPLGFLGHDRDRKNPDAYNSQARRRIDVDFWLRWILPVPAAWSPKVGQPLPLFIKWDDTEYSLRARRPWLCDGHVARCRHLAHGLGRQGRRNRLAGLLPPAQPAHRRRRHRDERRRHRALHVIHTSSTSRAWSTRRFAIQIEAMPTSSRPGSALQILGTALPRIENVRKEVLGCGGDRLRRRAAGRTGAPERALQRHRQAPGQIKKIPWLLKGVQHLLSSEDPRHHAAAARLTAEEARWFAVSGGFGDRVHRGRRTRCVL